MTISRTAPRHRGDDRVEAPTTTENSAIGSPVAPVDRGRRDRKKQATRRALRAAALELVAARGFAHVTIEDITEAADVATRTFFNYFPSKEAAVIGWEPEEIEQLRMSLIERPAHESPIEALRAVAYAFHVAVDQELDDLGENRTVWLRRFCIVRNDPDLLGAYVAHTSEIEKVLVDALAERLGVDPAEDPYPALVAGAVIAASRSAALFWSSKLGSGSLAKLTDVAIDCLAGGLADKKAFVNALGGNGRRKASTASTGTRRSTKVDNYS